MFYTVDVHWRVQIRPIDICGSFCTTKEFVYQLQMVKMGKVFTLNFLMYDIVRKRN